MRFSGKDRVRRRDGVREHPTNSNSITCLVGFKKNVEPFKKNVDPCKLNMLTLPSPPTLKRLRRVGCHLTLHTSEKTVEDGAEGDGSMYI